MMIPPMISKTTAGIRSRGAKPTVSGARTATAATTSRLTNDTSGMSGHQRLCLRLAGGPEPAGDVVGDAEGVGDDGQGRVDRRAGHEEARVHHVDLAWRYLVQRARLVVGAVPRRPPTGHRVLTCRGLDRKSVV